MALSGNKGEWSEIYTLFKLLGDGKVHAGDANMNKLELYYPIINIIREESKKYEYQPNTSQHIVIINENGKVYARIKMHKFLEESSKLLTEIKQAKKSAFEIPNAESFMGEIGCSKLKAPSSDKADIHIIIHDLRTNMTPLLGFSIKSQLGHASTLLNAGTTTNITYQIVGATLTDAEIEDINGIDSHLDRMATIYEKGCSLVFQDIDHPTFKNNLQFLDYCMPQFIADCLIEESTGESSSIDYCVSKVAQKNPFEYSGQNVKEFYAHKMKVLLLSSALGMMPGKEWTGRYDANGGYLVVRKDGEIVCYHFYNQNDVEDYLYNNTRFERASRRRYKFGELYRGENNDVCIKLNLQIRFKK